MIYIHTQKYLHLWRFRNPPSALQKLHREQPWRKKNSPYDKSCSIEHASKLSTRYGDEKEGLACPEGEMGISKLFVDLVNKSPETMRETSKTEPWIRPAKPQFEKSRAWTMIKTIP